MSKNKKKITIIMKNKKGPSGALYSFLDGIGSNYFVFSFDFIELSFIEDGVP